MVTTPTKLPVHPTLYTNMNSNDPRMTSDDPRGTSKKSYLNDDYTHKLLSPYLTLYTNMTQDDPRMTSDDPNI